MSDARGGLEVSPGEHGEMMGTYDDSKYQKARRETHCACCLTPIERGTVYLCYLVGQRSRINVCEPCSTKTAPYSWRAGLELKWRCRAVEERLASK